jgi:molecular chaperone GrpE
MQDEELKENIEIPEDEDVVEFVYNADGEEDLKATLKKLRKDLKESQKEKQEYLTSWQRERADFMNYRKGEIEHNKKIETMAREHFAEELLPVLDAYDMAFANKEAWEKVDKNWRMGVEYIHQQLLKVLGENGIEEIPVKVGDAVDPNLHEAMSTIPAENADQDHTIAQVIQKGYKNGDKVFRPARVTTFEYNA